MERCDNQNACPICKRYNDGCLYAKDGSAAICVRTPEGAVKMAGEAGWLHILKPGDFKPKPVKKKRPININWNILQNCYWDIEKSEYLLKDLSKDVNISIKTLRQMQIGWDGAAFTMPVFNSNNEIVGIQRRFPNGSKRMVKGSAVGVFIPPLDWTNLNTLYICEGFTDTATALDMGLRAIGRLSCQTGKDHIIKFCIKKKPSQIVIIADNDEVGEKGALTLGREISQGYKLFATPCPDITVIVPEAKDLRQWVKEKGQVFVRNKIISLTS